MIRINKYLSLCGVTSRRGAEAMIREGRVAVNGHKLDTLGVIVDETTDKVTVDGGEISLVSTKVYVVLNKPPMVMTTLADPFGRKTVVQYLKGLKERVYPVGRLDYDTEGVLLLTNDGDLAYRLAHPRYAVPKVYEALVKGLFTEEAVRLIGKGLTLEDGATGKARVTIIKIMGSNSKIRLVLTEGRKREVKQLCKLVKHPVLQLRRTEFGSITSSQLAIGRWRYLNAKELLNLRHLTGLS